MRRALAIAIVVLACGAQTASAQPLTAARFSTQIPDGWGHNGFKYSGITAYTITSPGTQMASLHHNIPAAGGIAIEISSRSVANLEHVIHHTLPKRGPALLKYIAGIPPKAKHTKLTAKDAAITVAGAHGGIGTVTYTYDGAAELQRDIAVRHGKRAFLIELVCRPDLEAQGQAALSGIVAALQWR
jgi:hypothetical protein